MRLLQFTVLAVALLTQLIGAQVSSIPGSGCLPASPSTVTGGPPKLGNSIKVGTSGGPCARGGGVFVLVGIACTVAPSPFGNCGAQCSILIPDFVVPNGMLTLNIPNDPALVGGAFCLQAGCFTTHTGAFCFQRLNEVMRISIQP